MALLTGAASRGQIQKAIVLSTLVNPSSSGCMRWIAVWLALSAGALARAGEAPQPVAEYEVKAAFLYSFASFVTWPSASAQAKESSFVVGVLGDDPFGKDLDRIAAAKTVGGKKIVIRRFLSSDACTPCHILFLSSSIADHLPTILMKLQASGALLVGDTEGFAQKGVHINFYLDEARVRLEANRRAAERAGLKISSKLLRLARIVGDDQAPPKPGGQ